MRTCSIGCEIDPCRIASERLIRSEDRLFLGLAAAQIRARPRHAAASRKRAPQPYVHGP